MAAYLAKISGPLLDRIDVHIEVQAVSLAALAQSSDGEPSSVIKQRMLKARAMQRRRLKCAGLFANAQMSPRDLTKFCTLDAETKALLHAAIQELRFSWQSQEPAPTIRSSASPAPSRIWPAPPPSSPITSLKPCNTAVWIGNCGCRLFGTARQARWGYDMLLVWLETRACRHKRISNSKSATAGNSWRPVRDGSSRPPPPQKTW